MRSMARACPRILILLFAVMKFQSVMADEKIAGDWQGTLGLNTNIKFTVKQSDNDNCSVTLTFLIKGEEKSVPAASASCKSGKLSLAVPKMSSSYEGYLEKGVIRGEWKQDGKSYPLVLLPSQKLPLSPKDMEYLLGKWQGSVEEVPNHRLTVVFRFELTDQGKFLAVADSPDQNAYNIPITDVKIADGILTLQVESAGMIFRGQINDDTISGPFRQYVNNTDYYSNLVLKKQESDAEGRSLELPREAVDLLLGKWNGRIGPDNIVLRFEKTKKGDCIGFIDIPAQRSKGLPVTTAKMRDGKIILKVKSIGGEFMGVLSNGNLAGDWKQKGISNPLSLTKQGI
jgi:hypothetical protein